VALPLLKQDKIGGALLRSTADVPLSARSVEATCGKTRDNEAQTHYTETHYTIQQRGHDDDTVVIHDVMHRFLPRRLFLFYFQTYTKFHGAYVNVV